MHERNPEQKNRYFGELTLTRAGFMVSPEKDGLLPVELESRPLCLITGSGGVRYWEKDVAGDSMREALGQVTDIAGITDEYMGQMETAPVLKADSLDENYRLLAEFNGTVLAGHLTKYGAQFITWTRGPDGTSLNHGNYYGPACGADSYTAAKQNFAVRSGLVDADHLLTQEQMVEVYHSIQETLDGGNLSRKQESLLEEVRNKIQRSIPDLEGRLPQISSQEPAQGMEQSW